MNYKAEIRDNVSKGKKIAIMIVILIVAAIICAFLDLSWVSANKSYTFKEVWDTLIDAPLGLRRHGELHIRPTIAPIGRQMVDNAVCPLGQQ